MVWGTEVKPGRENRGEREGCAQLCLLPETSQGIPSSKDRPQAPKLVCVLDLAPFHTSCNCSMNPVRGKEGRRETRVGVGVLVVP